MDLFELCTKKSPDITWQSLATENDLFQQARNSGEALRSWYKRERRKRGVVPEQKQVRRSPVIVCLDIERTPILAYSWGIFEENIGIDSIVKDSIMLSWSAKRLNDSICVTEIVTSAEIIKHDDKRIVVDLWNYLNGAQIIIGHNVKDFDMKFINTRFLHHGLPPLSSYKTIDTLTASRRAFDFTSNKLKYINRILGIKQKIENSGMALWVGCMNGDDASLEEMKEYNAGDVFAVEDLYYRIRPFIENHPNIGLYNNDPESQCSYCGSIDLEENGFYYTATGKYYSFRCKECGALSRTRTTIVEIDKRKKLLKG